MKIGIVSPYYMHRFGGVQTLILEMRELLQARGHQVIIVAPKPKLEEHIVNTPSHVMLLGVSREINFKMPFHTTLPLATSSRFDISNFLEKEQFDVLNIHEPWMPLLNFQIVQEAICPIVATSHAYFPRSFINESIEKIRVPYFKLVAKKVDKLTAVSEVAARHLKLIKKDIDIEIIPNAISLAKYQAEISKRVKRSSQPYILYLNRLEKRKGPLLLLKAYHLYHKRQPATSLRLVMAGNGPLLDNLQQYVAKHGLKDKVSFPGFVSEEEKLDLFANAHLYVSPAPYGESFGIVLLEAMAAGVPILAGDNEGYRTVLTGFANNCLVKVRDRQLFAAKLENLIHNQALRDGLQEWNRLNIDQYDYDNIINQYERCFHEVTEK